MNTKDSSEVKTERQPPVTHDSALHQEASVQTRNENRSEAILTPGISYSENLSELGSIASMTMRVSEKWATDQAGRSGLQAPTFYGTSRGQMYAFKPQDNIHIGSSDPNFTISFSDAPQPGPAFVKYHAVCDGNRFYAPSNNGVAKGATGDVSAYQICSPSSSLPQGLVMASTSGPLHSTQQIGEETSRKREIRLMKNREAARECRRKKKEYVKCLENRVAVLENQNKTLIEELKALKDLYCRKNE